MTSRIPRFLLFPALICAVSPPSWGQTPPDAPAPGGTMVKKGTMIVAPPPGLILFNQAMRATEAGKFAESEKLYQKLIRQQPNATAAWANLALLQGRRGAFADAAKSMGKAAELAPKTAAFPAQQSSFYVRSGELRPGERSARKALAIEPKNVIALANLSDILFQQRRFAEAIPALRTLRILEMKTAQQPSPRTEISLILALGSSGQQSEALTMARQRAQRYPKDTNSQLLLGDAARLAGKTDEARAAYQKAATLDPKNINAKAAVAYLAMQQGDQSATLKLALERLKRTPEDARLHFQVGYLYYSDTHRKTPERYQLAEASFLRAATINPKNPQYVTYTAIAVMLQGPGEQGKNWERAQNLFNSALSLDPKFTLARMGLANMGEQSQQYKMAEAQYRAILAYAPQDVDARRGLAGTLFADNRHADAFREMETLAAQKPKDTRFLSELASWQFSDGKFSETQKTYERVLQRDPNNIPALIALGRIHENAGQWDIAQKRYSEALNRDPKNATAALLRGQLLVEQKRPEDAIAVFRRLLDADPGSNVVRWQLALALREQKRFDESLAEMQAITLRKDDANRVMYLLGAPGLLMEQKKYPEAVSELVRLRRENPNDSEIAYTLADAYEKAAMPDNAEKTLEEIAATSAPKTGTIPGVPQDIRPIIARAGLYERAGKFEDAANAYEDAVRLDASQMIAVQGLSRTREKLGKPEAAAQFVENLALADAKTPSLPALGAARQLHLQNKTIKAFVDFTKRLIEKYPDNRDALYVRARLLSEETSDYKPDAAAREEAVVLYDKILKQNAFDKNAQLQKAQQLEALNKKEEALAAYKILLKTDPTNTEINSAITRLAAPKGR